MHHRTYVLYSNFCFTLFSLCSAHWVIIASNPCYFLHSLHSCVISLFFSFVCGITSFLHFEKQSICMRCVWCFDPGKIENSTCISNTSKKKRIFELFVRIHTEFFLLIFSTHTHILHDIFIIYKFVCTICIEFRTPLNIAELVSNL